MLSKTDRPVHGDPDRGSGSRRESPAPTLPRLSYYLCLFPFSLSPFPLPPPQPSFKTGRPIPPRPDPLADGRRSLGAHTAAGPMRPGRPEVLVPGLRNKAGSRVVPRGRGCVHVTATDVGRFVARTRVRRHFPIEKAPLFRNRIGRFRAEHPNRAKNDGASGGKTVETLSDPWGVEGGTRCSPR